MQGNVILKSGGRRGAAPNMADYEAERAAFSWEAARCARRPARRPGTEHRPRGRRAPRQEFEARPRGASLHRPSRRSSSTSLTGTSTSGRADSPTCSTSLGVEAGERVFALLPRARRSLRRRLRDLEAPQRALPAVLGLRSRNPSASDSLSVTARARHDTPPCTGTRWRAFASNFPTCATCCWSVDPRRSTRAGPRARSTSAAYSAEATGDYEIGPTDPEDMALLHFTSGTTGTPKGAIHVHDAVVSHYATGRLALDLHPDDVFWCTADPGWVTGTSYGIISPLVARRDQHRRRGRLRRRALVPDARGRRRSPSGTRRRPHCAC